MATLWSPFPYALMTDSIVIQTHQGALFNKLALGYSIVLHQGRWIIQTVQKGKVSVSAGEDVGLLWLRTGGLHLRWSDGISEGRSWTWGWGGDQVSGVWGGGSCRVDLQRRYEESEQRLGTVHRIKAGGCKREVEGHNIYGTSTGAEAIRERKTGWLEAGGGGSWR